MIKAGRRNVLSRKYIGAALPIAATYIGAALLRAQKCIGAALRLGHNFLRQRKNLRFYYYYYSSRDYFQLN